MLPVRLKPGCLCGFRGVEYLYEQQRIDDIRLLKKQSTTKISNAVARQLQYSTYESGITYRAARRNSKTFRGLATQSDNRF